MPALPTVTTSFLTSIRNYLTVGPDIGGGQHAAAGVYLRAQDLATALDLLQDAFDSTTTLTVVSGSTTTLVDSATTFATNAMAGQSVVFASNTTTTALAGVTAKIASNTTTTLTFTGPLPAACVSGDTYTIKGTIFDDVCSALRQGHAFGGVPAGNIYGDVRTVRDACVKVLRQLGTAATGVLTFTGQPADTETVTIGAKTYTFQATLTNSNGNVKIGVDTATSINNLVAAVMLGSGSGTAYAAAMTANVQATGVATSATVATFTARAGGTAGNSVVTTETITNASFGGTVMSGGAAGAVVERTISWPGMKTGSGCTTTALTTNVDMVIDQFRGRKVTVGSDVAIVQKNTATVITLETPLSSAPSASTTITITIAEDNISGGTRLAPFPGGQPGNTYALSALLDQVQASITAFTNPI